jgi:hypothetical protein
MELNLEEMIKELSSINVVSVVGKNGESTLIWTVEGSNVEFENTNVKANNDDIEILSLLSKMYISNDLEIMREIFTGRLGSKTFNSQNKSIDELKYGIMVNLKKLYPRIKHLVKFKKGEN